MVILYINYQIYLLSKMIKLIINDNINLLIVKPIDRIYYIINIKYIYIINDYT